MDANLVANSKLETLNKEMTDKQAQKYAGDIRDQYLIDILKY